MWEGRIGLRAKANAIWSEETSLRFSERVLDNRHFVKYFRRIISVSP